MVPTDVTGSTTGGGRASTFGVGEATFGAGAATGVDGWEKGQMPSPWVGGGASVGFCTLGGTKRGGSKSALGPVTTGMDGTAGAFDGVVVDGVVGAENGHGKENPAAGSWGSAGAAGGCRLKAGTFSDGARTSKVGGGASDGSAGAFSDGACTSRLAGGWTAGSDPDGSVTAPILGTVGASGTAGAENGQSVMLGDAGTSGMLASGAFTSGFDKPRSGIASDGIDSDGIDSDGIVADGAFTSTFGPSGAAGAENGHSVMLGDAGTSGKATSGTFTSGALTSGTFTSGILTSGAFTSGFDRPRSGIDKPRSGIDSDRIVADGAFTSTLGPSGAAGAENGHNVMLGDAGTSGKATSGTFTSGTFTSGAFTSGAFTSGFDRPRSGIASDGIDSDGIDSDGIVADGAFTSTLGPSGAAGAENGQNDTPGAAGASGSSGPFNSPS